MEQGGQHGAVTSCHLRCRVAFNYSFISAILSCPLPAPLRLDGISCLSDPFSKGIDAACVTRWYYSGAVVLFNAVFGDLTAILAIIEFVRPEKLIARHLIAPRSADSQSELTRALTLNSDFYLPFRYQLVLKVTFLTCMFCSAIPLLLPCKWKG